MQKSFWHERSPLFPPRSYSAANLLRFSSLKTDVKDADGRFNCETEEEEEEGRYLRKRFLGLGGASGKRRHFRSQI